MIQHQRSTTCRAPFGWRAPIAWKASDKSILSPLVPLLWLLSLNLAGCGVVKGIFKAGVWFGVLSVCVVLGLVMYGASRLGRRS
jgi:hypothetical protein